MSIPIEKLKRAFPEGMLAKRGVQTIKGWQFVSECVIFCEGGLYEHGVKPLDTHIIYDAKDRKTTLGAWIGQGDLLPNVDPRDAPTWACLIRELAKISKWEKSENFKGISFEDLKSPAESPELYVIEWGQCAQRNRAKKGICFELSAYSSLFASHPGGHAAHKTWVCDHLFWSEVPDPALALVEAFIQIRDPDEDTKKNPQDLFTTLI